jgi:hypothetical protein
LSFNLHVKGHAVAIAARARLIEVINMVFYMDYKPVTIRGMHIQQPLRPNV